MVNSRQGKEAQGLMTKDLAITSLAINSHTINIHQSELLEVEADADANSVSQVYSEAALHEILATTLQYMDDKAQSGVILPYFDFAALEADIWTTKPKELDVYITDLAEAKTLNLAARGKDYATNILSYPSELPPPVLQAMPTIPLGELIICHEVVVAQAHEQNKPVGEHATHLVVHGILHLLGFDHELGDSEADDMEGFEIEILERLGLSNPYLLR